jgi:DNA-binding MarR family transcriptional regulator
MSDENAEKLFLQEKPTLALLFIGSMGRTYASIISKEIDSTFAHTTRILAKMEQCGLIRFTFEGRIKFVELTDYGREVETSLKEFRDLLSDRSLIENAAEESKEEEIEDSSKGSIEEEKARDTELVDPEQLDPLSAEIFEKIKNLRDKIENIYKQALEQGDNKDTISRKLGPYSRDIKKLKNQIDRAESPVEESVLSALEESERLLEIYLKK